MASEQPTRETWVDAWMRSQPADVLDSDGWLGILAKALNGMEDAAYARGIAEGLRQGTEGWEREWAMDLGLKGAPLHPWGSEAEARRGAAAREGRTVVCRLVGPWEPADPREQAHGEALAQEAARVRLVGEINAMIDAEEAGEPAEQPEPAREHIQDTAGDWRPVMDVALPENHPTQEADRG